MSLFKYGDLEVEVDFMDADFFDNLETAQEELGKSLNASTKTGKKADIIRAQIVSFDHFFDTLFGGGAGNKIRQGRNSFAPLLEASEKFNELYGTYEKDINQTYGKYQVIKPQGGNRQQRRHNQKQHGKPYPQKRKNY